MAAPTTRAWARSGNAAKAYWADPSAEIRAKLGDYFNFEGVRNVYLEGVPERLKPLFPPDCWHFDWERMRRPGNFEIQFKLFEDYKSYVDRSRRSRDITGTTSRPA